MASSDSYIWDIGPNLLYLSCRKPRVSAEDIATVLHMGPWRAGSGGTTFGDGARAFSPASREGNA